MVDPNIIYLTIGLLLGIIVSFLAQLVVRWLDIKDRKNRTRRLLIATVREIKIGEDRCRYIANIGKGPSPQGSLSRIYTAIWDANVGELSQYLPENDLEDIHYCYAVFDLVNLNQEKNRFPNASAFAQTYVGNVLGKLDKLIDRNNLGQVI